MCCIGKSLFRTALIGGLVLGGSTLVLGPQRMMAGATQIRNTLVCWVDDNVDDPVIIRQQLQKLQAEYPAKIRDVRQSLSEVDGEIAALSRDNGVATKVITMAKTDLETLAGLVDQANVHLASSTNRPVVVKFQGRHLSVDQAYTTASRIKQTAENYHARLSANERDLTLLSTQRQRLADQLSKLENEYSNFQAHLWQIERQINAIERNEELIEMMEEREVAITENDSWRIETLDGLSHRLAAIQQEHEAVLETLSARLLDESYEDRVKGSEALTNGVDSTFEWDLAPQASRTFPQTTIVIDEYTVNNAGDDVALLGEGN